MADTVIQSSPDVLIDFDRSEQGDLQTEEMLVNMKLALAANVKAMRQKKRITQQELAKRIGSSQSRIAKMEVADRSVSMELFVRSLAALGASRTQIGKIVGTRVAIRKQATQGKKRTAKV